MIRSSSASASHHRHLEEHTPSPLARSFSVGIDGEETSNSYSNKSLTKSLTTTGRIVSQRPNHFKLVYHFLYIVIVNFNTRNKFKLAFNEVHEANSFFFPFLFSFSIVIMKWLMYRDNTTI